MGASRDPLLAQLKKAFAASHGCDERTARRHFNRNSEEWQAFLSKQGREAARNLQAALPSTPAQAVAIQILGPASPAEIEKPSAVDTPDDQLPEPAKILKAQWRIYKQASEAWSRAVKEGDEIKAIALGQATIKAQDAFYKAKAKYDQWELDERRKIPATEFHAFRAQFVLPLVNLLRGLPAQLGVIMNPKDNAFAIRVGTEYMVGTVHPQIQRLIAALDDYAPEPQLAA